MRYKGGPGRHHTASLSVAQLPTIPLRKAKMTTKPTILLVPGGCTESTVFDPILPLLRDGGYEAVAASLGSANPKHPDAHSAESDARHFLKTYLQPLLDAGKDVVVYAYSWGGTCLGTDGPSLTKRTRSSRGEQGGVLGIVYMSSALPTAGQSQLDYLGGTWPFFVTETPGPNGLLYFDPIIPHLFNDAPPALQTALAAQHIPTAANVFRTGVLPPLWADEGLEGRRVWLLAMQDATFPPEAARMFMESSGVEWEVVERDVGHCGVVTQPEGVADVVMEAARKWIGEGS